MKNSIQSLIGPEFMNLVDVGAKGRLFSLGKLNSLFFAYAFEPDPIEFQKLQLSKNSKKEAFAGIKLFQEALSTQEGKMEFYMAGNSSYNSLLEPDLENFWNYMGLMDEFETWKDKLKTNKKIEVNVSTLDTFCRKEKLDRIDLLKLDVQGSELSVLKGAEEQIREGRIGIIFTEVSFIKVYKGQALFSDIDQFLLAGDFKFIDCRFYPDHVRPDFARPGRRVLSGVFEKPRYSSGGDAVYLYDFQKIPPGENRERMVINAAVILAQLGYFSHSYSLLNRFTDLNVNQIHEIILLAGNHVFLPGLVKWAEGFCPPVLLSLFRRLSS